MGYCGAIFCTLALQNFHMSLVGDYQVKADLKGRIVVPSSFRKQLLASDATEFVLRKDIFQNCLVLYPRKEWDEQVEYLRTKLNDYNRIHKKFKAQFFRDTSELALDANGRLLLPKRLLELAGISAEMVFAGMDRTIEIWDKEVYDNNALSEVDFADLAEDILGQTNDDGEVI